MSTLDAWRPFTVSAEFPCPDKIDRLYKRTETERTSYRVYHYISTFNNFVVVVVVNATVKRAIDTKF